MKKLLLFLTVAALFLAPYASNAQTGKDQALETMGSVSAMLVYNTYLSIGAIADGFEKEAYDAETVKALMDEQDGAMNEIINSFDALLESGFVTSEGDKEYVDKLQEACGTLKEMADDLSTYSGNKSTGNADIFQATRNKAWGEISDILGLEEE
jgi:hypothetical protein